MADERDSDSGGGAKKKGKRRVISKAFVSSSDSSDNETTEKKVWLVVGKGRHVYEYQSFRQLKRVKVRSKVVANRLLGQRVMRVRQKVVRVRRVVSLRAASLERKGRAMQSILW